MNRDNSVLGDDQTSIFAPPDPKHIVHFLGMWITEDGEARPDDEGLIALTNNLIPLKYKVVRTTVKLSDIINWLATNVYKVLAIKLDPDNSMDNLARRILKLDHQTIKLTQAFELFVAQFKQRKTHIVISP